tara:strand:- start:38 stop:520 length:483 start_codon:yes stop_codon:yes gene_type:complete
LTRRFVALGPNQNFADCRIALLREAQIRPTAQDRLRAWVQTSFLTKEVVLRVLRHLAEQYLTSSQTAAHFLRQLNGRPHVTQVFCGKSDFFIIFYRLKKPMGVVFDRVAFFTAHAIKGLIHETHARIAPQLGVIATNEIPIQIVKWTSIWAVFDRNFVFA